VLGARSAEKDTREWCKQMSKKPQGEFSIDDAQEYASDCVQFPGLPTPGSR
jgi:hypothetical protein